MVHDDVHAGDGLADDADLGQLGRRPAGHLGHAEGGQLILERLKLLGELLFLLGTEVGALHADLKENVNHVTQERIMIGKENEAV